MQTFELTLESKASKSFRCQKAANSLDINIAEKLRHEFKVTGDFDTDYSIGVIFGASGSGKSTLAEKMFGEEALKPVLQLDKPVIEQFPEAWTYDECSFALASVGLNSVPCWIRPAVTLSNGQRARAECALQLARVEDGKPIVIDEWTSVVDRTVAKVMSGAIAKYARKAKRKIVLCTCHADVIEWLAPDWIVDCNTQSFEDRRLLQQVRTERLQFEIAPCGRESWPYFSKYHYLNHRIPGNSPFFFGLYHKGDQIGFQCFTNYVPYRPGARKVLHSNRTVVHPDYVGFGLGAKLIDITCAEVAKRGYEVRGKFSNYALMKSTIKRPWWELVATERAHKIQKGGSMGRVTGYRIDVATYSFKFHPSIWHEHQSKEKV